MEEFVRMMKDPLAEIDPKISRCRQETNKSYIDIIEHNVELQDFLTLITIVIVF